MGTITTKRLCLRRATWGDLEDIHAVMSAPEAMRYWSRLPHESLEVTRAWFAQALLDFRNPDMDERVIELDGRVVGYIGIWRMPEFGFILHPAAWGKGIASEAAHALIPHLFATHAIDRLTADVDPRNAASLRLLRNWGSCRQVRRSGHSCSATSGATAFSWRCRVQLLAVHMMRRSYEVDQDRLNPGLHAPAGCLSQCCRTPGGGTRAIAHGFHQNFNQALIAFFSRHLRNWR